MSVINKVKQVNGKESHWDGAFETGWSGMLRKQRGKVQAEGTTNVKAQDQKQLALSGAARRPEGQNLVREEEVC